MNLVGPKPRASGIDLASEPEFRLGGLTVRPAERAATMGGERRELQPRVMKVLVALARARPGVMSRERLAELCWDGRVVGEDALNRCILLLRHLADEFSPRPFTIQTVPRVGHRLVAAGEPERFGAVGRAIRGWRPAALLAALLLVVAAAGLFAWQRRGAAVEPASIAVLPFRNLSDGDPHFAAGVGEEILAQLAREPAFRVVGSSTLSQVPASLDARAAGRRLGVDYVVEGSVRRQGERVRVNAHLVRSGDGTRLWADSFDGSLDDIFAIQRSIGASIAGSLRRKLVRSPALTGPLVTDGNAYNLYLTARGLIRTRSRRAGPTAADLLRDALQIDPGYAPAWAALGDATLLAGALGSYEHFIGQAVLAQRHARQAVRLAPDLPEAHRALGGLLGFGSPESDRHLRRAAELDPNNAEAILGLGLAHGAAGEFAEEIRAYRRALEIDPLWMRAMSALAQALAEMGDLRAAEEIAARLPKDSIPQHLLLAKARFATGDFSESARHWAAVANANSRRWSETAARMRDETADAVGLPTAQWPPVPRPLDQRHWGRSWVRQAPDASAWLARNRNPVAAAVYRDDNHRAAKLMLTGGRSGEVSAAYEGPGGSVGIRRGVRLRPDQLSEAPVVALALRRAGRRQEAARVLGEGLGRLRAIDRRGRAPLWFDADAAELLAVAGRSEEALARLEQAVGRGWRGGGSTDLADIGDEPAFGALRGSARFERLRSRLLAHRSRERAETEQVLAARG